MWCTARSLAQLCNGPANLLGSSICVPPADANLDNDRVLQQWYAMNQANSLKDLQASVHSLQGIPWVNTLAVDDQGQTLYMNLLVVPNVMPKNLPSAAISGRLQMIVLDGSNSACAWDIDPQAAQKGIYAAEYNGMVAPGLCAALQ